MIVKDELDVIVRCLSSVKEILDYWVIVDTGSSDGTQSLILQTLQDIPGELYERPWVNFEHNRNEALWFARGKADYLLFMDADEALLIASSLDPSHLCLDGYKVRLIERSLTDVYRICLIKNDPCWFWKGVIHEALYASREVSVGILESLVKQASSEDGKRTQDPKKFEKDAAILEKALALEPQNSRYVFYLAQSYGNAGRYIDSLTWYQKRTEMGNDPEEVFWSFYCMGMIHQHIKSDPSLWIDSYTKAHLAEPSRAEPLFQLARFFYNNKQSLISYAFGKMASSLVKPECAMYFHAWIYDYAAVFVCAQSAEDLGLKEEARSLYQKLLTCSVPEDMRRWIETAIIRIL